MLDQKLSNGFPTLERLALVGLRMRFPGLKRKGFMTAVRAVLAENDIHETPFTIIPDSWLLEPSGIFVAVEIEDRHPLSEEKLFRYCELYDALDYCEPLGGLRLFVFDRYGHNERELDLCDLYLSGLVERYGPASLGAA